MLRRRRPGGTAAQDAGRCLKPGRRRRFGPWSCTWPSITGPPIATTARSDSGRRSSVCVPRRNAGPRVLSYSLKVEPAKHFLNWQQDPQGNWLARFVFPEPADAVRRRGRPRRRDGRAQPVRLLPRARRPRPGRSPTSACCARNSSPICEHRRRARGCASWLAGVPRELTPHRRLPGRPQPAPGSSEIALPHPHGARRPDAGGDPRAGLRLLPRQRLAAGADPAPSRLRRPLRLRLPDPAQARREAAGRAGRAPTPTSPTCTPGPRSTCPAPAGSASIRPRACWPARATSRWPPRPTRRPPRPITGVRRPVRGRLRLRDERAARSARRRGSPSPTPTSSGRRSWPPGEPSTRGCVRRRRPPDHGRRADLRRRRRHATPAEWNIDALGPTKQRAGRAS